MVVRYSEQRHRIHTVETCLDYAKSFRGTSNLFLAITVPGSNPKFIGTMTAYIDSANLVADMGILIGARQASGHGYATEAWTAVCRALFATGIRKVTAGTLEVNAPMIRLMRRVGMVPDGTRPRQFLYDGREVALIHMAMYATDQESFIAPLARPKRE
jgi:RimJ/RimL family protein N-acetyltransferase